MKASHQVKIIELIRSWGTGKYFFYANNLKLFRTNFATLNKTQDDNTADKTKKEKLFFKFYRKLVDLIQASIMVIRLFYSTNGKIIFFNHSQRIRRATDYISPVYLSKENFNFQEMSIIENEDIDFTYSSQTQVFNAKNIVVIASIYAHILKIFLYAVYRVTERDIAIFFAYYFVWKLFFKLLKPKKVMFLVWYGKEPIIAACKELGIEAIELQHGIMYPSHPWYNIIDGKKHDGSDFLLPDKCLVYGQYWKDNLVKSGWSDDKVEVVGYFLNISRFKKVETKKPYILYASSGHVTDAIISHIRSVEDAVRKRGWEIILTLHPTDSEERYKNILSETVSISSIDAYDILRDCKAIVGVSTTLLWEAMIFNKPAFIIEYGFEAVDLLSDLVSHGYGRPLGLGEFPEPFCLPSTPCKDFFFSPVATSLLK
jgi:hypothetical protein